MIEEDTSSVDVDTLTDRYATIFIKNGGVTALSPVMTTPDFLSNLLRDFLRRFVVLKRFLAVGTFNLFLNVLKRYVSIISGFLCLCLRIYPSLSFS